MINTNVKKQYPVIRMPNGHPVSSTMYNRGDLHGVIYNNDVEFDDVLLSNITATSTVFANLNVSTNISFNTSSLSSSLANVTVSKLINSTITTTSNITTDINLAYNLSSSLLATGTTTADLTVTAPGLLLDLYPSAAAAYSLRKLRTAYTGSAIRVRASTSGAEGDVSFDVNSTISASSTVTVTAVGTSGLSIGQQVTFSTFWNAGGSNQNVFVTTWYDQSGNARDATQTTQANQPQIVSSGTVINETFIGATNPTLRFTTQNTLNFSNNIANNVGNIFIKTVSSITGRDAYRSLIEISTNVLQARAAIYGRSTTNLEAGGRRLDSDSYQFVNSSIVANKGLFGAFFDYINAQLYVYVNNNSNQRSGGFQTAGNTSNTDSFKNSIGNTVASLAFQGSISEIIIYTTNQSANNTGINNNINTHYAIY